MENFPSNSHSSKPTESHIPATNVPTATPAKKIEKVVAGPVIRRKKPLGRRFIETFFAGDAHSVVGYVVQDILIPAIKDVIADVVGQGIERTLYGEARSSSRRTGYRPGDSRYVNYNRVSSPVSRPSYHSNRIRDEGRSNSERGSRSALDFEGIVLATRTEAEAVIDSMFDLLQRYGTVSVADLYELVDITGQYTDDRWGWFDLRGASAMRIREGYMLNLPKPEPLNNN